MLGLVEQLVGLGTNATSSGWRRYAIKQYLVPGLQPLRSSPTLIPLWNLRFASDFKVTFRYGFRLFVFVYALHSVVKPTHAPVFITTLRFIQTIASLKGFDHTIRSITLLVSTPRVLHARRAITPCPYFNRAKIILPNIWSYVSMLPNRALHIPIWNLSFFKIGIRGQSGALLREWLREIP